MAAGAQWGRERRSETQGLSRVPLLLLLLLSRVSRVQLCANP